MNHIVASYSGFFTKFVHCLVFQKDHNRRVKDTTEKLSISD